MNTAPDIFDRLESEDSVYDNLNSGASSLISKIGMGSDDTDFQSLTEQMSALQQKIQDVGHRKKEKDRIMSELKDFIREEVAKIKPIQHVIERQVEQVIKREVQHVQVPVHLEPRIVEAPPQIIREVRVEVEKEKKDPKKYAEEKAVEALQKKIDALESELKETRHGMMSLGGSGVIGIPNPERQNGKTLQVVNNQAVWKTGGGGGTVSGFTITNPGSTVSLDASNTSLDELASVVAQVINQLQA